MILTFQVDVVFSFDLRVDKEPNHALVKIPGRESHSDLQSDSGEIHQNSIRNGDDKLYPRLHHFWCTISDPDVRF